MGDSIQCPECGAELTEILARHAYMIEYSTLMERWTKSDGSVVYTCSNCEVELSIHDIEDALKQVDEL